MAKITVKGKEGGGGDWSPIPAGTVDLQIDSVEQGTTGAGNPNLRIKGQITGNHPSVGKTYNDFFVLMHKTLWRVMLLLDACSVEYTKIELEETDGESGEPLIEIEFDDDDLVGKMYTCDVTIKPDNQGRDQNDFKNYRQLGTSVMTKAEREAAQAERDAAQAAKTQPAASKPTAQQPRSTQPAAQRQPAQQPAARQPAANTGTVTRRSRA